MQPIKLSFIVLAPININTVVALKNQAGTYMHEALLMELMQIARIMEG
jgi:hypothetical protein